MSWDNLDDVGWGLPTKSVTDTDEKPKEKAMSSHRRTTECIELSDKFLYRRAYGEEQLLQQLGMTPLKDGHSYHCITGGNVDSLSYLKFILLHHDLDYCLFSTWCMAAEDILQFDEWLTSGKIKKLDAYVGEIFPTTYIVEWQMINALFAKHKCGRIVSFRNHSKIYAGWGGGFLLRLRNKRKYQHKSPMRARCNHHKQRPMYVL